MAAVQLAVEQTLGIKLETKIELREATARELAEVQREALERVIPAERLEGLVGLLQVLSLIPRGFDLEAMIRTTSRPASALYDPRRKVILFLREETGALHASRETMFHELVHAVQDQQHGLVAMVRKTLTPGAIGGIDGLLALSFLIEGEAHFWTQLEGLTSRGTEFSLEPFDRGVPRNSKAILANLKSNGEKEPRFAAMAVLMKLMPSLLVRLSYDPMLRGRRHSARLYQRGGARALRGFFRLVEGDPDRLNTRDFLFPADDGSSRIQTLRIDWPDVAEALGASWSRLHHERLGAFLLHVLFEGHGEEADRLARAWRGDRFELWGSGDARIALGVLHFSDPDSALRCAAALQKCFRQEPHPGAAHGVDAEGTTRRSLGDDALFVEAREASVLFAFGRLPHDIKPLREELAAHRTFDRSPKEDVATAPEER